MDQRPLRRSRAPLRNKERSMISFIDHIAIAVRDYERARDFFSDIFGAVPGTSAVDRGMGYLWQNFSLGNLTRLELLAPRGERSFLDNFLANREGGVHHITLHTLDILLARAHLESKGVPYFGFADLGQAWKELFIHPRDAFGVLIQIAQFRPDDWISPSRKMRGENKFFLEKTPRGIMLTMAHPSGGMVDFVLSREEAAALQEQLHQCIAN